MVGRLLPSEAELSGAYSASRVTIRKALEVLRNDGLVDSRQGFGWFVAGEAVRQPLGGLVTIEAQLEAEGRAQVLRAHAVRVLRDLGHDLLDTRGQIARSAAGPAALRWVSRPRRRR